MSDDATDSRGEDVATDQSRPSRTRRPRTTKAVTSEGGKRSLNLRIDDDVYERLTVHAMKSRTTISELVSVLTRDHCRDYSIHRVGARGERSGED
jgi:macrodomain Ter protein organizer (MatP/YcbG family)